MPLRNGSMAPDCVPLNVSMDIDLFWEPQSRHIDAFRDPQSGHIDTVGGSLSGLFDLFSVACSTRISTLKSILSRK